MLNPKVIECLSETGLILIIGRRGSGKSALGYSILEYLQDRPCYVYNFPKPGLLPDFISPIYDLEFPENSTILIDEAYMNFSSRNSLSKRNKFISNLNGLTRQKNLLVIYISQETTSIDINIMRGLEVLFVKALSINQVRFERKAIKSFLGHVKKEIDMLNSEDRIKKAAYISCDIIGKRFEGLIENANELPSFWNEEISKAWKGVELEKKTEIKGICKRCRKEGILDNKGICSYCRGIEKRKQTSFNKKIYLLAQKYQERRAKWTNANH